MSECHMSGEGEGDRMMMSRVEVGKNECIGWGWVGWKWEREDGLGGGGGGRFSGWLGELAGWVSGWLGWWEWMIGWIKKGVEKLVSWKKIEIFFNLKKKLTPQTISTIGTNTRHLYHYPTLPSITFFPPLTYLTSIITLASHHITIIIHTQPLLS